MVRSTPLIVSVVVSAAVALVATGCSTPSPAPASAGSTSVTAGWVSSIDQIGLPAALDEGFFDDEDLNVTLTDPFATGVDELNALETGDIQFAQVGAPVIGAVLAGSDYVIVGNYNGSASQYGIDQTMAVVARDGSGVESLDDIKGKTIGVSVGSINDLYLLAVLKSEGLTPDDVKVVNTAPADMAVALQTKGIDVGIVWDPFPQQILKQVSGSYQVTRGGGYIGFLGYIVAKREFAEANPDIVASFLKATASADQWMRQNPDDAAAVATRWISGLDETVAKEALKNTLAQLDPRISACNYAALDAAVTTLKEQGSIDNTFDVNTVFMPGPINDVATDNPDIFSDLPAIPESAVIGDGFSFDPTGAQCPQ